MNEQNQVIGNKEEKNVGFRTALYLDLPKIDEKLKGISEGFENLKLNSNLITPTLTPRTSDPKTFEYLKNCISSDLLKRLEESSPIKSTTPGLHRKISEIFLLNCDKDNFILTEKNDLKDEAKLKNEYKSESPEINFDEKAFDLKNLKQNTKNYLPKNSTILEDQSLNDSKFSSNEKDEKNERPAIPINFNVEKSESPRHKPAKYADSKSSPIFNYYNDTSEYFSQFFTGNYNNNYNNNKLVEKKYSNEFFKLHLLNKEDSNQSQNNEMAKEINGNNNLNDRERLNTSNFSPNNNENQQAEIKNNFKNFPILSRLPQKAELSNKHFNLNSETNGLVNGKSSSSSVNEINDDFNSYSKFNESNFHNYSHESKNYNHPIPNNFKKMNLNRPYADYPNKEHIINNNQNEDSHDPEVYVNNNNNNNNFEMMNHNRNYPFANNSNENSFFSKIPMQNFGCPMENYPMNTFFPANNPNNNFIENGEDNGFIEGQRFNNPNFNLNYEEQIKSQFWQKNFGKKNNIYNPNLGPNRNINGNFNGGINNTNGNYTSKFDPEEYIVEMFGKRGWICEACNNFNYESKYF